MVTQKRYTENNIDFHKDSSLEHYSSESKLMMDFEGMLSRTAKILEFSDSDSFINRHAANYLESNRKTKMNKNNIRRYLRRLFKIFRSKPGYGIVNAMNMNKDFLLYNLMESHYMEIMRIKIISLDKEKNNQLLLLSDCYDYDEEKIIFDRTSSKANSPLAKKENENDRNNKEEQKYDDMRDTDIYPYYLPIPVGSVIAKVDLIVICDRGEGTDSHCLGWKFQGCISEHSDLNWIVTSLRVVR